MIRCFQTYRSSYSMSRFFTNDNNSCSYALSGLVGFANSNPGLIALGYYPAPLRGF